MTSKYFNVPFANSGDKTSIPDASQPSGAVSFTDGYTPDYEKDQATDQDAKDVPRQGENYFKFVVTDALKEIQDLGGKPYDPLVNYPVGGTISGSDNNSYRCIIKNGPDAPFPPVVDPVGDTTGTWVIHGYNYSSISDLISGPSPLFDGQIVKVLGYYAKTENHDWSFQWSTEDLSTQVAADTQRGIYVAISSDPTGASGAWVRLYKGKKINALWFGALRDATGATITATAINAALIYSNSIKTTHATLPSGIGIGSQPRTFLPSGQYVIDASLGMFAYGNLVGEHSIISPITDTFPILAGVKYSNFIEGVIFAGGLGAASIVTGNIDAAQIDFVDCDFQEQTGTAVYDDTLSASTFLNFTRCRFYNTLAQTLIDVGSNQCNLIDSWVSASASPVFKPSATCAMHLSRVMMIPIGTGTKTWVENSGYFSADACRFGGESAAIIVDNKAAVDTVQLFSGVSITNSEVFSAGVPAVIFNEVPNVFIWDGNHGMVDTLGFEFGVGISDSANIKSRLCSFQIDNMQLSEQFTFGLVGAANKTNLLKKSIKHGTKNLLESDKILQIRVNDNAQYGYIGAVSNVVSTNPFNIFGSPGRGFVGDSATNNGSFNETWVTALNGNPEGVYTVVYDIEVNGSMPLSCTVSAGDNDTSLFLEPGRHVISVPTYFVPGEGETVGYSSGKINNDQSIIFSNIRIFKGSVEVDTQNSELYGTGTAPTTLQWEVNDSIKKVIPVVGNTLGIICTVAGVGVGSTWVNLPSI